MRKTSSCGPVSRYEESRAEETAALRRAYIQLLRKSVNFAQSELHYEESEAQEGHHDAN